MKILEIIPQLNSGGAERFVVDLCNEMCVDNEVMLIVLHSLEKHGFYKDELSSQVKVVSLNKKMGIDFSIMIALKKIIKKEKPHIVHTHLSGINYSFLSSLSNRKIIYYHTVHSEAKKESSGGGQRLIRWLAFRLRLIHPITISKSSDESFRAFYGINATLIVNGRNVPNEIRPSQETISEFVSYRQYGRILIHLARFEPVKRHLLMARVARRLSEAGYRFVLLMVGNQCDGHIAKEVQDINCGCIKLLGQKHNALDYLKLSDAFCLCSSTEGMPISLIEALGTGAIPVCTPVGGIVDTIVDGENGFLSEDISEDAYYNALERFLKLSDDGLNEMKNRVVESYKPYSMTTCAINYLTLFKSALKH